MRYVPRQEFPKCASLYRGDYRQKNFSCWGQYPAMAFAELAYRKNLRDFEACLGSMGSKPYHVGFLGKAHDVNILDKILPESGAFYVMDRGAIDFQRLYVVTLCSAFFVVWAKENVRLQRRYSHPVGKRMGICSDKTVILTALEPAKAYPDALRRIDY